jgi:glycosyltransferase involved in cell wall biosynthesis
MMSAGDCQEAISGESPVRRTRKLRAEAEAARNRRIACLSNAPWNPYLRLLYGHLAAYGFKLVEDPRLSLEWLWRERSGVEFLHVHWPESLYTYGRGPVRLRPFLSWAKLVLFRLRLAWARMLGYRLVWTIHQILPHESVSRGLDLQAARFLSRACHLLLAHDRWTATQARSVLGTNPKKIAIVPHGSYVGVYPEGRLRSEVRSELGLPEESFVFLCFGELRAYKEIELLLAAFSSLPLPNARLIVAGNAKNPDVGSAVRAASAHDRRLVSMLGFVPEDRVAELFHACDAAVLPRGEDGTTGSLVLALSMGLPVVASDVSTARELTRGGEAGWLFRPHDSSSLRSALWSASSDPSDARARGRCASDIAKTLRWTEIARDVAHYLGQAKA